MRVYNTDPRFKANLDLARQSATQEIESVSPAEETNMFDDNDVETRRCDDRAENQGPRQGKTA